jgi:hypothetical protein
MNIYYNRLFFHIYCFLLHLLNENFIEFIIIIFGKIIYFTLFCYFVFLIYVFLLILLFLLQFLVISLLYQFQPVYNVLKRIYLESILIKLSLLIKIIFVYKNSLSTIIFYNKKLIFTFPSKLLIKYAAIT